MYFPLLEDLKITNVKKYTDILTLTFNLSYAFDNIANE